MIYWAGPPFSPDKPLRGLGVATGLAWTSMGWRNPCH